VSNPYRDHALAIELGQRVCTALMTLSDWTEAALHASPDIQARYLQALLMVADDLS
jgi:hypothetical protein